MQPSPQPIAHGDLEQTPLLHILSSLRRRKASGTLVVWSLGEGKAQDRLLFSEGELRAMRSSSGPGVEIEPALLELVDRKAGRYAFYKEDLVGDAVRVSAGLDFAPLVAALLRRSSRLDGSARVLAARREQLLRVRRGHSKQSLGLDKEEAEVFDVMRAAPVRPDELASRSGRPEVARRLLYLLELVDALEVHEGEAQAGAGSVSGSGRPPRMSGAIPAAGTADEAPHSSSQTVRAQGPEPSQARLRLDSISKQKPEETLRMRRSSDGNLIAAQDFPAPPSSLNEDERGRWIEIQAKTSEEDRANHFEFLGVAESATTREIEAAFVRMAKLCHPDRLTPSMQALRPFADHLFRRATAAREALVNPTERAEYMKLVAKAGGTPEAERREREIVSAALDYAKVDALIRRKAFADAYLILDKNLELSPEIADYPAKKAEALMSEFGMDDPERRQEMLALLDRALALDETHENANFRKGQLLKRMGETRAALAHFQACVESNPHHIDAARELRIARMRKDTPPEGTGLFGRLFKKK